MSQEVKVGLALGGGVARGIAHVGVLQALEESGIPIHIVAGTSAGSIVGALYAAGLDPWLLERVARELNWRGLVRLRLRRDGLLDAEGLEQLLRGNIGDLEFSQLRIPFAAVACDLLTGEEVVFREGRVAPAVRASASMPGVFLPVRMGARLLVDGGIVNNVPVSVCRAMGADYVIGVDLNRPRDRLRPPRNLLHILLYTLALLQRPQIEASLAQADVAIRPDLSEFSVVELERVSEMVEAGRRATFAAVPRIRADLERLRAGRAATRTLS
ncbi:patatin-like phospholipase family protein [Caldinitratiruptor microaerophilus]|uniref:NTE family protein YlbK n=1 Tax=Caldinitratiruptor microaerophilus TaxID=671077 RepID=A0AA35CM03_9FIRM|nr:patatin-like phospholipase family protein [Caldinitratiruptor microaerophilus]BDG61800.1 putative NTE family protein YlbK [Caldinitratiruptor microaerophilus]